MKPHIMLRYTLLVFALILQSAWAQTESSRATIHCPYCGSKNAAAHKFCEACGSRMPELVTARLSAADSNINVRTNRPERSTELPSAAAAPAKALYEAAMLFVRQSNFEEAAKAFRQIAKAYPECEYAEPSINMARACEELAQARHAPQKSPAKTGSSNAVAFGGAFIGALAGTLGSVLVLIAIAGGG